MTFKEQIKTELHEMAAIKICSQKKSLKACAIVDADEDTFTESSGMSVSDAASLALELC